MADPAVFLDLLARAELRSASGDWAEAAELWVRVTEANPVHGDYWARLAEARFAERDFAAAAPAYAKVLELGVRPGYQVRFQALLHHLIRNREISRRGALFVIIGRLTFSAAQNTATAIGRETEPIFVGEPTGSRPNFNGEVIPFELPYSKLRANVGDLFWQTSWPEDHRTWIAPDIYAPPTFEAFRRNDDPAMDAILALHEHLPGR